MNGRNSPRRSSRRPSARRRSRQLVEVNAGAQREQAGVGFPLAGMASPSRRWRTSSTRRFVSRSNGCTARPAAGRHSPAPRRRRPPGARVSPDGGRSVGPRDPDAGRPLPPERLEREEQSVEHARQSRLLVIVASIPSDRRRRGPPGVGGPAHDEPASDPFADRGAPDASASSRRRPGGAVSATASRGVSRCRRRGRREQCCTACQAD